MALEPMAVAVARAMGQRLALLYSNMAIAREVIWAGNRKSISCWRLPKKARERPCTLASTNSSSNSML